MSKKIEIKKVVIDMGDNPVELTIEQARELKDALIDLLGSKETVYIPSAPVIVERPYIYPYNPYWRVTWSDTGTTSVTYSLNQ